MAMKSFDCPREVWTNAQKKLENTKYSSISEALRDKLREIADMEVSVNENQPKFLDIVDLSAKQEALFRKILKKRVLNKNVPFYVNFAKRFGIYDRRDYVVRALKKFSNSDLPVDLDRGVLKVQEIRCGCGANIYPGSLGKGKTNGCCPSCGRVFVEFDEVLKKGFEVIEK